MKIFSLDPLPSPIRPSSITVLFILAFCLWGLYVYLVAVYLGFTCALLKYKTFHNLCICFASWQMEIIF